MADQIKRVTLIVLDSVDYGDAQDAAVYGDEGANTLANTSRAVGGMNLQNLARLGLGNLSNIESVPPVELPVGVYGRFTEVSAGKDTPTGHWELAGVILERPFPTYPHGFPPELVVAFEFQIGLKTLGNYPASGTEILKELGVEHLQTGKPIIYTSADSVFQIAAHEEFIPIEELYRYCEIARELLTSEHAVGRVIARPLIGEPGHFMRAERCKDFSVEPPGTTILDVVKAAGLEAFDRRLPEIMRLLHLSDVLFIMADHGNDPTMPSTDHSRERVPFLVYGHALKCGYDLGTRASFADVATTIADLLHLEWRSAGKPFAAVILV